MKVSIASRALAEGLNIAAAAASPRSPKPALQGVMITALQDTVVMMATDLEVGVRYYLTEVSVEREGEALVPVAKLSQIAREVPDESVQLELSDNTLNVRFQNSHFKVFAGDSREFPPVPDLEGQPDFILTGQQIRDLSTRTLFAAAKESTRYAIDGLLWERSGPDLKVVATDGRRLALASCTVEETSGRPSEGRVIVPARTMSLLARVVSDPEERFAVKFLSNQILVKSDRLTISSVLVEGHFPKYGDVIPQDCDKTVTVGVPEMLGAVRRAALLTSDESKSIRLSFKNGEVVMTGRAPEQGEASVTMGLKYDGEPIEIGFNPTYLSDVLKVLDSAEVSFHLKDPNRPGLFRKDQDYLYVVMPVNLS